MQINELPLISDYLSSFARPGQPPHVYGVVFMYDPTDIGTYTWRGIGQYCPRGGQIVGVGHVVVVQSDDGEYSPVAVCLGRIDISVTNLQADWQLLKTFDPHQMKLIYLKNENQPQRIWPVAILFEHG